MVGRKGLEPSHVTILVPKTNASTNSAIAPQIRGFYILLKKFVQLELINFVLNLYICTNIKNKNQLIQLLFFWCYRLNDIPDNVF